MAENNEKNNDMLKALDSIETVKVGDVVKGEVLAIDDDRQAIVGIKDAGVEGVVPAKELSTKPVEDINDAVKVGDELDLVVISKIGNDKENGSYLLSHRRLEARKVWDDIQKKFDDGETITAKVTQAVKGGLVVDAGVRGFVPASMITDHYVEDLNQFISALFSCIAQSNKTGDLTSLIRLHLEQSVVSSVYRRILVGTWLVRDSREET